MSYKYTYSNQDIQKVSQVVNSISRHINDKRADGYTQWAAKQDLYRLKFMIDEALGNCPKFSPEDEWLREIEKLKLLGILSKE